MRQERLHRSHPRDRRPYWNTPFGRWISEVTVQTIVAKLRSRPGSAVTTPAVYHWVRGANLPRPQVITALVQMSEGRITINDIYDHAAQVGGHVVEEHGD